MSKLASLAPISEEASDRSERAPLAYLHPQARSKLAIVVPISEWTSERSELSSTVAGPGAGTCPGFVLDLYCRKAGAPVQDPCPLSTTALRSGS